MADKWIGTYKTFLWNTPDGNLGEGFYGMGGLDKKGNQTYIINVTDEMRKTKNIVGDWTVTRDVKDLKDKVLALPIGERIVTEHIDDKGVTTRVLDTQEKFDRLRTVKDEAKPEKVG